MMWKVPRAHHFSAAVAALVLTGCGSDPVTCPPDQELINGQCQTLDSSAEAMAFCLEYEGTCGFGGGNRYASAGACESAFDAFSAERQDCVTNHLGLAMALEPDEHCPHATGQHPCD